MKWNEIYSWKKDSNTIFIECWYLQYYIAPILPILRKKTVLLALGYSRRLATCKYFWGFSYLFIYYYYYFLYIYSTLFWWQKRSLGSLFTDSTIRSIIQRSLNLKKSTFQEHSVSRNGASILDVFFSHFYFILFYFYFYFYFIYLTWK